MPKKSASVYETVDAWEAEGAVRSLSDELMKEDSNRDALRKVNERHAATRKSMVQGEALARAEARLGADTVRRVLDSGITGITPTKLNDVKCLHAQLADELLSRDNAVGKAVLDGVHLDLDDEAGLIKACQQGRALGFDGKLYFWTHGEDSKPASVVAPAASALAAWSSPSLSQLDATPISYRAMGAPKVSAGPLGRSRLSRAAPRARAASAPHGSAAPHAARARGRHVHLERVHPNALGAGSDEGCAGARRPSPSSRASATRKSMGRPSPKSTRERSTPSALAAALEAERPVPRHLERYDGGHGRSGDQ